MASMLSLLDVMPRHERLNIGDGQIVVFGISSGDIGKILQRYPDVFQQIAHTGGQPQQMDQGLLGALLAASQRNGQWESLLGNDEAEQRARSHAVSDQVKMLQAVGRTTFADGLNPFLEALASMSASTADAMEVVVQAASKEQATVLRRMPKPSASPATPTSGS